jgi:hypothetical protein
VGERLGRVCGCERRLEYAGQGGEGIRRGEGEGEVVVVCWGGVSGRDRRWHGGRGEGAFSWEEGRGEMGKFEDGSLQIRTKEQGAGMSQQPRHESGVGLEEISYLVGGVEPHPRAGSSSLVIDVKLAELDEGSKDTAASGLFRYRVVALSDRGARAGEESMDSVLSVSETTISS